jgi:hypothetical protein
MEADPRDVLIVINMQNNFFHSVKLDLLHDNRACECGEVLREQSSLMW